MRDGLKVKDQQDQWKILWAKMIKEIDETYQVEIEDMRIDINNGKIPKNADSAAKIDFKNKMRDHWTKKLNAEMVNVNHILVPFEPV